VELPEAVRARLVSLVAASLGDVMPLPAALKQVAGFAPARRARLGATTIVAELERDGGLRERIALQVRVRATGDGADQAVLAWLERPEGWQDAVRRAVEQAAAQSNGAGRDQRDQRDQREQREQKLRDRAEEAERILREQRRSHKEALEALKAEVTTLRRTLGETRTKERAAREDAEAARGRAEETVTRLERELRALRAQVAKLEEQVGAQRRQARTDRDDVTVRARLLLETINDAAVGLRRELGLPNAAGNPGDRIEAELAQEGIREPSSTGSLDSASPALLEQYLAMPRSRLVVDGYNVTKSTWPTLSLEAQRARLLALLPALVARTNAETTVVFDAAASETRPVVASPRRVKVLFSPAGVIADDVIRDLVAAEPPGRVVVVVTEDRALADDVRRAGARVVGPSALTRAMS
jgi:predicted RNA-binding protein with PIN domain